MRTSSFKSPFAAANPCLLPHRAPRSRPRRPKSSASGRAGRQTNAPALSFARRAGGTCPSGDEDDLADVSAILDVRVGGRCIGQAEGTIDMRADLAFAVPREDLIEPSREHLELVPHMAQVDAQHALVGAHERERIYLKPRDRGQGPERGENGALPSCAEGRQPEADQPSGRSEQAQTLSPGATSDGVEDHVYATAPGEPSDLSFVILGLVVDRLVEPPGADELMLARRGSAVGFGPRDPAKIDCREADTTRRLMD